MMKLEKANNIERADIVIVGNGIAGLTAAVESRRLAPDKQVVIVTDQSHPTINTPALKQFAIGKLDREQLLAYPPGTERAQFIHVVNARVEEIHAQEKYVALSGGRGFGYGSLLIATGSGPSGLPANMPGRDFDGVLTLHRLNDYLDLRRRLPEVQEAAVIGGGAHAIETVMGLLYWGIRVHWLIRGDTFMSRTLDRPASEMVLDSIRRAGAQVYTETEIVGVVGRVGVVAGVVTNHRQLLPCQLVLVCTGTSPITALAKHCDVPMNCKNGILVDDALRTNVRDIYAAGDVAAIRDPQTGIYAPRAQWYAAVLQGRKAAAKMTGAPCDEGFGVPWHATKLAELSMLTVGNVLNWHDGITTLTDSGRGSYRRMCVMDDRLVGYLSLGSTQPDSLAIKRIIDEGLSIREIQKALLKGTFDARSYFSRKRTYAAQLMVESGKLPVPAQVRWEAAAIAQTALNMDSGPLVRPLPQTGPLAGTRQRDTDGELQLFADPFVTAPFDLHNQPTQDVAEGGQDNRKPVIVESTLVALPSRSTSGSEKGLRHYSSKLPAIRSGEMRSNAPETAPVKETSRNTPALRQTTKRQFLAPPPASKKRENTRERQPGEYPTSSLWSYTDKLPVTRKKGR
ncbi:MAG TPA: FAD-dependent oxidoreductase [Ktedonobacteraceae bacterium]|jgi:NADPH-dependent 2,4-dienoyl-CoA reductase/sulfur reductase-like enzyme|nr:FAD-dependent oxidoreductase [Ktedonobacteraceae bacterium]